jgi:hypothetical protein
MATVRPPDRRDLPVASGAGSSLWIRLLSPLSGAIPRALTLLTPIRNGLKESL